jgi:hypothetical protein
LWCAAPLPFVWWMKGTKYDGILAFIGDAFISLCHKFHGFVTKEAITCSDLEEILCLSTGTRRCSALVFPFHFAQ